MVAALEPGHPDSRTWLADSLGRAGHGRRSVRARAHRVPCRRGSVDGDGRKKSKGKGQMIVITTTITDPDRGAIGKMFFSRSREGPRLAIRPGATRQPGRMPCGLLKGLLEGTSVRKGHPSGLGRNRAPGGRVSRVLRACTYEAERQSLDYQIWIVAGGQRIGRCGDGATHITSQASRAACINAEPDMRQPDHRTTCR